MAKMINKTKYDKVPFGSDKFLDLGEFETFSPVTNSNCALSIICTDGSKRVKFSKILADILNSPEAVKIMFSKDKLAICTAQLNDAGSFAVRKGGIIYSSELANKVISMITETEVRENASTRCGIIEQIQEDNNGSTTVILGF